MHNELFCVYEREKEQVGIGEFGDRRTFIRANDGVLLETKHLQLHELGPHIAALKRDGFAQSLNGAFYNEKSLTFARRHSDFKDKNYLVFIRESGDVNAAVARIETIGLKGLQGDQRKSFNEWLRSLDLSSSFFVAYPDDPVPVLALCEYAFESSKVVFASQPGLPAARPSSAKMEWVKWLSPLFGEAKVLETYSSLWPTKAFIQPAPQIIGDPSDLTSFSF